MPSLVRGPGVKASYCNVPIVQWDFLQTFYDLAGGSVPLPEDLDGGVYGMYLKKVTGVRLSVYQGFNLSFSLAHRRGGVSHPLRQV